MADFGIVKRNSQGIFVTPAESELFDKGILFLTGEISENSAEKFCKQMLLLKKDAPVTLVINSPGGEIGAGLSIISTIKEAPVKVNTYCLSRCYSMAAVIFSCGTGERMMSPYSKLMFHEPLVSGRSISSLSQVEDDARLLSEKKEIFVSLLSERTGMERKKIRQIIGKDRYFDEGEAKRWNLSDKTGVFFA